MLDEITEKLLHGRGMLASTGKRVVLLMDFTSRV